MKIYLLIVIYTLLKGFCYATHSPVTQLGVLGFFSVHSLLVEHTLQVAEAVSQIGSKASVQNEVAVQATHFPWFAPASVAQAGFFESLTEHSESLLQALHSSASHTGFAPSKHVLLVLHSTHRPFL